MQQEIKEGNRLIAEFSGDWKKDEDLNDYYWNEKDENDQGCSTYNMQYHTSFDWIMPVWVKLRSRVWQTNNGSYPVDFIAISEEFKRECFNATVIAIYEVVLKGVKWYNSKSIPAAPSAQ